MADGPFVKVKLYTADGGFVVAGEIPRFNQLPDVIVWGERFFRYGDKRLPQAIEGPVHYVECFTVALVREVPA